MLKRLSGLMGAFALAIHAPASAQEWWYVESDNFRIYSESGEDASRELALNLEKVDLALRVYTGAKSPDEITPYVAKPTIYHFGKSEDIGALLDARSVLGFFIRRAGRSVAFSPITDDRRRQHSRSRGTRDKWDFYDYDVEPLAVLYHEYAHYFMFQNAPAAYPMWYSEGFAEFFGNIIIEDDKFFLGAPQSSREAEIALANVDLDEVFPKDERNSRYLRFPYYGHGWLLTSYLSLHPERKGQLHAFLTDINQGTPTRKAAEAAFGDLGVLEKQLSAYRKERAMMMGFQFPDASGQIIQARKLAPDEAAIMPAMIALESSFDTAGARAALRQAQDIAQRFPSSDTVKRVLMEGYLKAGDFNEARDVALTLADGPHALEAQMTQGYAALEFAKQDSNWLATARKHFLAANALEPLDPRALTGYYLSYRLGSGEPPENALVALEAAYSMAMFDNDIRRALAHLLLTEGRDSDAMNVLAPYVNQPHSGKETKKLRELMEQLEDGEREPLMNELAPSLDKDDD
ncbi:tetratricopeptide repeat protein [Qipengyuania sphaerica]|uniref:tetratricopeptide repeat protein n=1 Tax=Qipengyuania sphaerica TaxID=2867243 RepID=UPI001C8720BF|nr:hypothetical protein [Qipengyuania sphaerica]MBX7540161.1 hypothetical protein [Qipengyuania sphaerica]